MKITKTVSQKVIDANRKNAQCNTGPTSSHGKDTVRYNAVKHGPHCYPSRDFLTFHFDFS